MISEIDKHRANMIQIVGFALMTPLGSVVGNLFNQELFKFGLAFFLIYLLISFFLFYCGIICLLRSIEILKEGNK